MRSNALFKSFYTPLAKPRNKKRVVELLPRRFDPPPPQQQKKNKRHKHEKRRPLPSSQYRTYIRSKRWKRFRARYFATHPRRCVACPSTDRLQLHHRTYKRLGCERDTDLIILCRECHERFHDFIGGSKKNMTIETSVFLQSTQFEAEAHAMLRALR